jgi:hypothetical protein
MRLSGAANLRQKTGRVIWGGLVVLAISVESTAAQAGPFHALFGEGYDFLQKKWEAPIAAPDRHPVLENGPFQTLFADGYAVTRAVGQPLMVTKPVVNAGADMERSPFEVLFGEGGEGYGKFAPRG